jgi:hypothetical protein
VPVGPSFKTYLPKGTLILGRLELAKDFMPNHYGGRGALTPRFHTIRTMDGKDIPIDGHIMGDLNQFKAITTVPTKAICCEAVAPSITTVKNGNNFVTFETKPDLPTIGLLEGAWRRNPDFYINWKGFPNHYMDVGYTGLPSYRSNNLSYNGLIIPKNTSRVVPGGAPMLLELATTTSLAVGSNVPVAM